MNFNRIKNHYFRRSCVHIEIKKKGNILLFYYLNIKNTLQLNKHFNPSPTDRKTTAKKRFLMFYDTCVITYNKLQIEI